MRVLNEPVTFDYTFECRCMARLQPAVEDVMCCGYENSNDKVFICECPVCGIACIVPDGVIPPKIRELIRTEAFGESKGN